MTRERLTILGSIALIILLTYGLLNASLITDVLAPFIYATLLTIGSAINSLPQLFVWIIFMLIVVQLLFTGLVRFARAMQFKQVRSQQPEAESALSPVQKYKRWIDRANQGVYFRWRIVERLIQITQDVKGRGGTRSRPQLEQEIRDNTYDLPDTVSQFLRDGMNARNHVETPGDRIQSMINNRPADHSDLATTLTYLEEQLGIRNLFDEQTS